MWRTHRDWDRDSKILFKQWVERNWPIGTAEVVGGQHIIGTGSLDFVAEHLEGSCKGNLFFSRKGNKNRDDSERDVSILRPKRR